MEKKQLFNSSLVGFYPNTHVPCFNITINIGDDELTDNYLFTQTINLDDTFVDTFNKINERDYSLLRLNITGNNITSTIEPILIGYKGTAGLYFREGTIQNPDKNYERIYIRNIDITSIDIIAKTANLQFAQRRLTKNEFTGNGSKFLSDDGTYKTIEVGDKTNVLILSLENDLDNGQKDSPVTAEVSTALKDAISAGKACVIKSANSDILANLQQTGDNVTIIMEQISRVGQTFVAVNTTITVNTSTNIISDYQTGAIVLETEGDGSKFLSNDGSYKEIPQSDLSNYLAKDNTTEYTPTNNYNPATKKYVDDKDNVAKLRLYNGLISLQHTAGKSLINDTCESFADFIAIFDNLQQLDGTKFTNPFTGMTLPTNVNEFIEAFQSFQSTYNVYDSGHLVYPIIGTDAIYENIIIIGFYRNNIGPAKILFGNKNYSNLQANSIFGIGIDTNKSSYYQIDDLQSSTLSLNKTLVTNLIEKVNSLDLSDYIKKNNTTVYTPTGNYNPATKKYVDDNISLNNKNVFVVNDGYNLLDIDSYSEWTETISVPKKLSSDNTLFIINMNSINTNDNFDNSIIVSMRIKPINSTVVCRNNITDAVGNKYNINILIKYENSPSDDDYYSATFTCERFKYTQRILTESEYAALGTTPETDNVLYFVTPD